ncbi:hypothetical protein M409DRAFT_62785 [Zasmidium cellare ATCC 36951]|uniref:Deacetylase sirtuin-type domain-containing protein n=1 Tax=Zasmidium cellare ATCC 36951 TaxID=1080233 RepID=A0A6A6D4T0_ZASCE|nr:uncharacterized protein M409DRAFT_62785 [Zasmidium cellare ATCC 36951]KAF2173212.1 hypothetical protein M409DRAFT_62785 [Zasmidium cellare ATCC 36951]
MDDSSDLSSPLSSVPSSPLSSLASSPSPPPDMPPIFQSHAYPSPPASQQTSHNGSPVPDGMASSASSDKDGPPPAKRRRISKDRSADYLDLYADTIDPDQQAQLDRLLKVLHKRQKIVVIAGAGISVSAGIPDFRSAQGLFRTLKEEHNLKGSGKHLFDASVYKDDVSTSTFHDMVSTMSRLSKDAKPTAFHHMLATIAQEGRLLRLYSQNVDGIDTSLDPLKTSVPLQKDSENKWPRTVQLHGGLDKMVCSKCHELSDLDPKRFDGPVPPLCQTCEEINDIRTNYEGKRSHGIGRLRPRMVLYNEHNPDDEAIGAVTKDDLRKRPDAVIVVGTTLKVPGVRRIVREMCATVRDRRGGVTIWINNDPPPVAKDLEDCWDIIVEGPSDAVAKHAAMRKWDDPVESDEFAEVSDEDAKKVTEKKLSVLLPDCNPIHATLTPLPSAQHKNNSFRPPLPNETPRKPLDVGPTDWSPIVSPRNSIIPSIESESAEGDNIIVTPSGTSRNDSGLLTPSKSQRNTPVKKDTKKSVSLNDKLKDRSKKATTTKGTKKAAPTKRSNVKYIKTPKSQAKPGPKSKKAQAESKTKPLTNAFKSSKISAMAARAGKNDPASPMVSPSKLRQVSNATSIPPEPMHPLSPQDPRNNTSPATMADETVKDQLPSSYSENQDKAAKNRSRMSVSSFLN